MALSEIQPAIDSPDTVFAKINAAIDAVNALTGEPARATSVENQLAKSITDTVGLETVRAQGEEGSLQSAISAEVSRAEAQESALGTAITKTVGLETVRAEQEESTLQQLIADETTRAETQETTLGTAITKTVGLETVRAEKAEGALQSAIAAETTRAEGQEGALAQSITDTVGLETVRAEKAEGALQTALAGKADLAFVLARADAAGAFRPADTPDSFTSVLTGSYAAASPLPAAAVLSPSLGPLYRLPAGAVIALRKPVWLEPQAFFALRVVLLRLADPTLVEASAVNVGVQWLDGSLQAVAQDYVADFPSLVVKSGVQIVTARVPSASSGPSLVPPAGAVFARPFVRDLSLDGILGIAAMTISDVTNAGVFAPDVSSLAAALTAIQSRLAQLGG